MSRQKGVSLAVIIEGISIVVQCRSVVESYAGGLTSFIADLPNSSFCADGELAVVSFMTPSAALDYADKLVTGGLKHLVNSRAVDIVIVDQLSGIVDDCDWAQTGETEWNGMELRVKL